MLFVVVVVVGREEDGYSSNWLWLLYVEKTMGSLPMGCQAVLGRAVLESRVVMVANHCNFGEDDGYSSQWVSSCFT